MPSFMNNLNMNRYQLLNVAIQNLATHPANPVKGQIYFNTADSVIYVCTDPAVPTWVDVGESLDGDEIITLINGSTSVIDLDNLPAGVSTAITQGHTHGNKALLDTYNQTNANLSDAVSKKHAHSNQTLLDAYTQTEANLAAAVSKAHEHTNKAVLDAYDQTNADIKDAVTKKHAHANATALNNVSGVNTGDETQTSIKTKLGAATALADGYLKAEDFASFTAKGVTNGDAHDHNGGDGGTIAYSSLSGRPTLGSAASKDTGIASGQVPILGANGKLADSVIPALAINEPFAVTSQADMLALAAQKGDIAIRSDLNKAFVLGGSGDPTILSDWLELLTPTDSVLSVNGKTGAVTLTKSDVGLGNVTNESKATMFSSPAFTGTPTAPTASSGTSTTQIATTAFVKNALVSVARKYGATIGDGTNASFTLTHNFNTRRINVSVFETVAPYGEVFADVEATTVNTCVVRFAEPPASGAYEVTVIG